MLKGKHGREPGGWQSRCCGVPGKGGSMVAKKSSSKRKSRKVSLKRETLKDLSVGSKAKEIKGGSLVECQTHKTE
jgi:hypothetical protein